MAKLNKKQKYFKKVISDLLLSINAERPKAKNIVWNINPVHKPKEVIIPFFLLSRLWLITNKISGPGVKVKANDDIRNNNISCILWI